MVRCGWICRDGNLTFIKIGKKVIMGNQIGKTWQTSMSLLEISSVLDGRSIMMPERNKMAGNLTQGFDCQQIGGKNVIFGEGAVRGNLFSLIHLQIRVVGGVETSKYMETVTSAWT